MSTADYNQQLRGVLGINSELVLNSVISDHIRVSTLGVRCHVECLPALTACYIHTISTLQLLPITVTLYGVTANSH